MYACCSNSWSALVATLTVVLMLAPFSGSPAYASGECEKSNGVESPVGPLRAAADELRERVEAARIEASGVEELAAALHDLESELARAPVSSERAALEIHLGRTMALLGDPIEAAAVFARAEAWAREADDPRLASYAIGYRGELYEEAGRLGEALQLTRRAELVASATSSGDARYRWAWQLGRLQRQLGDAASALESYQRAVDALEAVRSQLASPEAVSSFRTQVEPVYEGLVDLLLRKAAATSDDVARTGLLRHARDTVELLRVAELRDHFQDDCLALQVKSVPEAVPGAIVVYPIVLPDRLELLVSWGNTIRSHTVEVDAGTLNERAHQLRTLLEKRTTRQYREPAAQLYDWIVRPIESSLGAPDATRTLVFVSSGPLRGVPMAALWDREEGHFVVERFPIATAPSLRLTDPKPLRRDRVALLGAGITRGVEGFSPLPAVAGEMKAIGATFPSVVMIDESFRRQAFADTLTERPFDIVHVASHGEFSGDPEKSFLLTWDGPMAMNELADLVSRTRFRTERPLELLTLSACQTAAGDDRAALGIGGAAARSGARSVIATLWSIDDEASALLMQSLYRELATPGVSRAEALRRAQRERIADPATAHPANWAAFLLIGSWL